MLLYKIWNMIVLKRKRVVYGKKLTINGRIYIHGKKSTVRIGNNVTINSSSSMNPTSGFMHTHLRAEKHGSIIIGDSVGISHANIMSESSVVIEDNVLLGSGVKIWDTDFHPIDFDDRVNHKQSKTSPIRIKEGAFIGACSIILKGVTIGKHSVVGAGSVVTKNIPDNEIWAGNPARFVGKITGGGGNIKVYCMHFNEKFGWSVA